MKLIIFVIGISILCGCIHNINVQTTKPWENHYMTVEEFKSGTSNIVLDVNESIWVISNETLKRVLKNTDK